MPVGWWLAPPTKSDKAAKQSQFLLAVFVHKNNPDIVSDPIDAPTGVTRETMRKRALEERVDVIASGALAQGSTRGKLEESMLSTKATLMKQNIVLQETEGIEKQLSLMERFKSSYVNISTDAAGGEHEHDTVVREMLYDLPFMKKSRSNTLHPSSHSRDLLKSKPQEECSLRIA